MWKTITARLREPSTHAALATIAAAVGVGLDVDTLREILLGLAAVLGLFGIGMREKGG